MRALYVQVSGSGRQYVCWAASRGVAREGWARSRGGVKRTQGEPILFRRADWKRLLFPIRDLAPSALSS